MYYFGYNVSYGDSINEYIAESHMKSFKISGECIMFIGFEVWKLWLAFDGVLHSNSRTIWALASFTVFSFGFSIMMIIESVKWVEADEILEFYKILPEWLEELKLVNRNLLIALSCISFCIIPATFYSAFNVGKDFRWDAYKKIGASIVSVMVMLKDRLAYWYAFTGFFSASLIAATGTTVLAIMCLLNFNKGLKEYVQWKPFSKKIPRRQSAIYSNTNQANTFHRLEDQRADEPIDDE
ncbi:hypothetical protein MFLAVUS_000117 [Mucor flavus]|uniref:Uncharacterized protein n=1 Tax=Mucor flavus TaxID=439312 RepID=A0ABP9YIT1_9FUNG